MNETIIITAGGIGTRMGAEIPKQFIVWNEKPILMHTIEKFYHYNNAIQIIVVLPKNHINSWNDLVKKYNFLIKHEIIHGGEERFYSIKNGLSLAKGNIIGVHDAVRPFVSIDVIKNCFANALKFGSAVPVISINESIRRVEESFSVAVDRNLFKIVQTPQCFSTQIIVEAYKQEFNDLFTDDASVVEKLGHKISLVEGNKENIKITTPFDLKIAQNFN